MIGETFAITLIDAAVLSHWPSGESGSSTSLQRGDLCSRDFANFRVPPLYLRVWMPHEFAWTFCLQSLQIRSS